MFMAKDKKDKGAEARGKEEKPQEKTEKKGDKKRVNIIRVMETNLDGNMPVKRAIRRVKGVSFMLSNAIAHTIDFSDRMLGEITDAQIQQLEDVISHPEKHGIPQWMYNRRFDPVSGETKHVVVSNMDFTQKMDINEMKKKKTYKGQRHAVRLTVRGQRTRGSFRKGKQVGVSKKKK